MLIPVKTPVWSQDDLIRDQVINKTSIEPIQRSERTFNIKTVCARLQGFAVSALYILPNDCERVVSEDFLGTVLTWYLTCSVAAGPSTVQQAFNVSDCCGAAEREVVQCCFCSLCGV